MNTEQFIATAERLIAAGEHVFVEGQLSKLPENVLSKMIELTQENYIFFLNNLWGKPQGGLYWTEDQIYSRVLRQELITIRIQ